MANRMEMAPWPYYDEDERNAVQAVLESGRVNYWTGSECRHFEKEFAEFHGVKHGIALANGTLALELALRVLGVGEGDEVIVTPRSFFGSASCIVQSGATPVFADVDPDSQNITAETIEAVITDSTKAIIAVHLAGWPCDMPSIVDLASRHDLKVIEDCAQAHGAEIDGRPIGSFGDFAAFSFCQDKIITTGGEGGMLLTNDDSYWSEAWSYKDHGKNWNSVYSDDHPPGFRWLHDSFGTNWRLTEMQGAIGRLQLRKLESWTESRTQNAKYLIDRLGGIKGLRIPEPNSRFKHAYYKFYAFVETDSLPAPWSRDAILEALQERGCPGLSGSCAEIYREGAFEGRNIDALPVAHRLGLESMALPVHPTLRPEDLKFMADTIVGVFSLIWHDSAPE